MISPLNNLRRSRVQTSGSLSDPSPLILYAEETLHVKLFHRALHLISAGSSLFVAGRVFLELQSLKTALVATPENLLEVGIIKRQCNVAQMVIFGDSSMFDQICSVVCGGYELHYTILSHSGRSRPLA